MDESEDPIAGGKNNLFYTKIKPTNKNYPIGEKTDWLDWTRQDWTGQGWTGQGRAGQ